MLVCLASTALVLGCASSDGDSGGQDEGADTTTNATSSDGSSSTEEATPPSLSPTVATTTTAVPTTTTTTTPPKASELPRGGTEIFPAFRVVAHYGNAQSASLGILGETAPEEAAARLLPAAEAFAQPDRPVLPAFELIVSVAQGSPGPNGTYSIATPEDMVWQWLEAARAADMLLVLDLQPGTQTFLEDARRFERILREPDVGLALDAEWRVAPGVIPGQEIGTVDAAEINEVSAWLADIVAAEGLPEKLFVLHLFTESMISNREAVVERPGLATTYHVDGFGGREVKLEKYEALKGPYAKGLKLFHDEDTNIFGPADVLGFVDPPDLITYQ